MWLCVSKFGKDLLQRDILVQQNPQVFQPVLDFFRSEYKAMNFESEAEKTIFSDIYKEEFRCQKRRLQNLKLMKTFCKHFGSN